MDMAAGLQCIFVKTVIDDRYGEGGFDWICSSLEATVEAKEILAKPGLAFGVFVGFRSRVSGLQNECASSAGC